MPLAFLENEPQTRYTRWRSRSTASAAPGLQDPFRGRLRRSGDDKPAGTASSPPPSRAGALSFLDAGTESSILVAVLAALHLVAAYAAANQGGTGYM